MMNLDIVREEEQVHVEGHGRTGRAACGRDVRQYTVKDQDITCPECRLWAAADQADVPDEHAGPSFPDALAVRLKIAVMVPCPGYDPTNPIEHEMRDNCYSCAPFWKEIPYCPHGHGALRKTGAGLYCRTCRKHYSTPPATISPAQAGDALWPIKAGIPAKGEMVWGDFPGSWQNQARAFYGA